MTLRYSGPALTGVHLFTTSLSHKRQLSNDMDMMMRRINVVATRADVGHPDTDKVHSQGK
ncbi:hypothetical protein BFJ70_g13546 [Fusarium oxysporum]|nr:hypothetical protein BFJ70_g13546 [Fusarium oxysporum]